MATKQPEKELSLEEVAASMDSMSESEKRDLLLRVRRLRAHQSSEPTQLRSPKTDDELWDWIRDNLGYEIPRVAVCPDHCAPFDFVADFFFERKRSLLLLSGRECGKTLSVAIVHYANSELKPGVESITFGAIQSQAKKAYDHVRSFVYDRIGSQKVLKPQIEGEPLRSRTEWKNGSVIEIITGSKSGVNSPHPQKVHADEVDLMLPEVWQESRAMSSSKVTDAGLRIKAQDVATSTRKSAKGTMQMLINEIERDIKAGYEPAWTLYANCIFEIGKEVPNCRQAPQDERIARLNEVGEDPCSLCNCVVEGTEAEIIGNLLGGFRRRYNGPVVDLITASGKQLTVTANHPVLTTRGWIAANLIQKGDKVLSRTRHQSSLTSNFNQMNATVENIFASAKVDIESVRPPFRSISDAVTPSAIDFHGDGIFTDGEVELVTTKLGLSLESDFEFSEEKSESFFSTRESAHNTLFAQYRSQSRMGNSEFGSQGRAVFAHDISSDYIWGNLNPNNIGTLATSTQKTKFYQLCLDGINRDLILGRKISNPFTFLIAINDRLRDFITRRMASSSQINASFSKPDLERFLSDAGFLYKDRHFLSSNISFDEIVEVRNRLWNGHVYNFSTTSGAYFAGDIITHNCDRIVKGEWQEGQPRTLESVCKGRFFKSRGWMEHEDVVGKFQQSSQNYWEAQMECRRPETDGAYLPNFNRARHCIKNWQSRPELGSIWLGCDWGGAEASAVVWIQGPLHEAVLAQGYAGSEILVPKGAFVIFDELYEPGIGATALANKVVNREIQYRQQFKSFRTRARFADMAGRQQREDWAAHNPPLRTNWYISRDFDPPVEALQELVNETRLFVAVDKCPETADSFESWRQKQGKEVHDEASHIPAASRYCLKNVLVWLKRREYDTEEAVEPVVMPRDGVASVQGAPGVPSSSTYETERWRQAMGSPVVGSSFGPQQDFNQGVTPPL